MRIVVLDGHTTSLGDLDWSEFEELGDFSVFERTSNEELPRRAQGAEVLLTNKTGLHADLLNELPKLKYIGVLATGTNVVDVEAARSRGIVVTNVPAYSTMSVAQLVFALLLELTNHTELHNKAVHAGDWTSADDFCFTRAPLIELNGLTLGVVGLGCIGQAVARIAQGFGMKVLSYSRTLKNVQSVEMTSQEEIFSMADVVSLHCPLTQATSAMINKDTLSKMKKSAYLINTGRGGLIDEQALADALNEKQIAGAGLDVLSTEPPSKDNPLLSASNCIITPHIAWATHASRRRLIETALNNLKSFISGNPVNVV